MRVGKSPKEWIRKENECEGKTLCWVCWYTPRCRASSLSMSSFTSQLPCLTLWKYYGWLTKAWFGTKILLNYYGRLPQNRLTYVYIIVFTHEYQIVIWEKHLENHCELHKQTQVGINVSCCSPSRNMRVDLPSPFTGGGNWSFLSCATPLEVAIRMRMGSHGDWNGKHVRILWGRQSKEEVRQQLGRYHHPPRHFIVKQFSRHFTSQSKKSTCCCEPH